MDLSWTSSELKHGKYYFESDEKYTSKSERLVSLTHNEFDKEMKVTRYNPMEEFQTMLTRMKDAPTDNKLRVVEGPPIASLLDSCIFVNRFKNRWDVYHQTLKTEKEMLQYVGKRNFYVQFTSRCDRLCEMFGDDIHLLVALICDTLKINTNEDLAV